VYVVKLKNYLILKIEMNNSTVFLDSRRVCSDDCSKEARDNQNDNIFNYEMYQYLPVDCDNTHARFPEFSYDHINLTGRIGYGMAEGCVIDSDSQLRNDPSRLTRDKCRIQLFERIFQGVPNLRPGVGDPSTELDILSGSSSDELFGQAGCKREITEQQTYHPTPLLDCIKQVQDPKHIVEPFIRGGDNTRDYVRKQEFLEQCGMSSFKRPQAAKLH